MWLSFAPIPNYTARYYDVEVSAVDWFSIIFFLASILVGFVSIAILDTFGLRLSVSEWGLCLPPPGAKVEFNLTKCDGGCVKGARKHFHNGALSLSLSLSLSSTWELG